MTRRAGSRGLRCNNEEAVAKRPLPRDPVLRCSAVLRTGNDLDYQCDLDYGHPGSHHAWRFLWRSDGL